MDKLSHRAPADVVLVGDFNATSPSWCTSDTYNAAGKVLESVFLQLGLFQCVTSPTHLNPAGDFSNLLDLVLVSDRQAVAAILLHPPIGKSDHLIVSCQLVAD